MHPTLNSLDAAKRGKSILLLGVGLVHAIELERQARQARWNVKGPNFTALHALFDKVAQQAQDDADTLAERLVALGGTADGRVTTVQQRSTLAPYPIEAQAGTVHLQAMATAVATFGALARSAIEEAGNWDDADTADVFTSVSRGLDKTLWLLEAHQFTA